jgi:hypothetical protein
VCGVACGARDAELGERKGRVAIDESRGVGEVWVSKTVPREASERVAVGGVMECSAAQLRRRSEEAKPGSKAGWLAGWGGDGKEMAGEGKDEGGEGKDERGEGKDERKMSLGGGVWAKARGGAGTGSGWLVCVVRALPALQPARQCQLFLSPCFGVEFVAAGHGNSADLRTWAEGGLHDEIFTALE